MSDEKSVQSRELNIDMLRILACFMVVVLHVSAYEWYNLDVNRTEWKILNFYDSLVRSSVPIFFMISGKLYLQREQMKPIRNLFCNQILKLLFLYIIWLCIYAVDQVGISNLFSREGIELFVGGLSNQKYHLWYLPSAIGVYCLSPLLWCIAKYEKGKYLLYACVMFFGFGIVKTTILAMPSPIQTMNVIISKFTYELSGYSGYFLLGYVLSRYKVYVSKVKLRYFIIALLPVVISATKIGEIYSVAKGEPIGVLYGYMSLPVFAEAMLIFCIYLKIDFQKYGLKKGTILKFSRNTLGIYLLHPFVLEHLEMWAGVNTLSFNTWISVPALSIFAFLVCFLITEMLKKIPILRHMVEM